MRCNTGGHASGAERHAPPARPSTTLGTRATHARTVEGCVRDTFSANAPGEQYSWVAAAMPRRSSRAAPLAIAPVMACVCLLNRFPGEWIWPLFHPFGEQGFPYTEHISGKFQDMTRPKRVAIF